MRLRTLLLALVWLGLGSDPVLAQDRDTKVRNDRKAFADSQDWIYNNLAEGVRAARETHKPLMVVFRCIPCEACQEFDDDVARRDPIIRDLLDQFVCVRIVQANTMDLTHFQFDFDLSLAVFFVDADLTIYGRFGTRSGRPEEQDISLEGLRKAMVEALRMHRNAAIVKPSLAGKQARPSRFQTPRDYPSLSGRYRAELDYAGSVARSCIHCHQIRDAERRLARSSGKRFSDEVLYPYPDPEVVGLKLNPREMATIERVTAGSSADRDGFRPGDAIVALDGQPLLSIADLQWVLHNAPATAKLPARVRRDGSLIDLTMTLNEGWRRGNISWRPTSWQLRQLGLGGMKLDDVKDEDRRQAKIPPDRMALKIAHVGEFGEHAVAKRAGLQRGDILVSFDGIDRRMTESQLLDYTLRQKHRGDLVALTVLRDGMRKTLSYALP
ncbi:MAG TPA: Trx7/PDZ domain-containing (seleno)protein [Isosphaeraceae bacterium]|nr:Trx7/PDZ domain-containing (seleno)protein [Isosphaeraceae bacterium]